MIVVYENGMTSFCSCTDHLCCVILNKTFLFVYAKRFDTDFGKPESGVPSVIYFLSAVLTKIKLLCIANKKILVANGYFIFYFA